jgi:hypothetical protein
MERGVPHAGKMKGGAGEGRPAPIAAVRALPRSLDLKKIERSGVKEFELPAQFVARHGGRTMSFFSLFLALATSGFSLQGAPAPNQVYEVWKLHHNVFADPHSYARVVARLEKGARLEVLERGDKWGRVRVADTATEGWSILDRPPGRAGDRIGSSAGGQASPASLALVIKGFDELARLAAQLRPDTEETFASIQNSFLTSEELHGFAKDGGLRITGERG